MIFCFYCLDGEKTAALRKTLLEAHMIHVEKAIDHMKIAGPIRTSEGDYKGSLIMIEAETEDEARRLFMQDPYASEEIWETVEVFPFTAAAGQWIGGVTWEPLTKK